MIIYDGYGSKSVSPKIDCLMASKALVSQLPNPYPCADLCPQLMGLVRPSMCTDLQVHQRLAGGCGIPQRVQTLGPWP